MIGIYNNPPKKWTLLFPLIIALAAHGLILNLSLPRGRFPSKGSTFMSISIVSPEQAMVPSVSQHPTDPLLASTGPVATVTPPTQRVDPHLTERLASEAEATERLPRPTELEKVMEKKIPGAYTEPDPDRYFEPEWERTPGLPDEGPSLSGPISAADRPQATTEMSSKSLPAAASLSERFNDGMVERGMSGKVNGKGAETFAIPKYKENPPPPYPRIAKRRGYEGRTVLEVEVFEDGTVGSLKIFASSGFDILDRSALDSVKKWVFIPGTKNGKRVRQVVLVPVRFSLQ